ncbi:MAG TPA: TadE/TadG family type IV pilus assembly protein [Acidobacteriaceae bacterium]|nr:TadE/TadG family type IV pilus assembly protein [Acidobacteriaceae bacterium]
MNGFAMTMNTAMQRTLAQLSSSTVVRAVASRSETARRCLGAISGEEGQTLAEMALVTPIMLAVLTGIFSFGIVLNQYLVLTNATNAGARAFALSRSGSTSLAPSADPCMYAISAITASSTVMKTSSLSFTITYTPSGSSNPNNGNAASTYTATGSSSSVCASQAMYTGDVVTVQAVYPVSPVIFGWASRTINLTASSTELVN